MAKSAEDQVFSDQLERWLKAKNAKTLASLIDAFEDKSFAIFFVFLMLLSALPIPTGGITNVLEIIVLFVALEMILGLKTIWLPRRIRNMELRESVRGKTIPAMLKRVKWFEERSNPRGVRFFSLPAMDRVTGLFVLIFTLAAFVAPPFTGLDTLPALGVVIMGLAIIFEDLRLLFVGIITGVAGTALVVALGAAVLEGAQRLL